MAGMFDALAAAVDGEAPEQENPVTDLANDDQAADVEPAVSGDAAESATTAETPAEKAERLRDEAGRFTRQEAKPPAEKAKPAPAPPGAKAPPEPGKPSPTPEEQAVGAAPRSWAPAVREHWGVLPRPVKDQILKREGEVSRLASEAGQARKFQQEFESVAAPYRALFTAPPVQVAANLFQTAAALQTGPIPQKAAIVAQMIRDFGIPPDAIADILEGKQAQPGAQQQGQSYRDPRVDDLLRQQQMAEQRAHQSQLAESQRALAEFEAQAEFLEDVKEDMAVLLESGRAKTYEEAYRKACAMNDSVATVLSQRKAEEVRRTQSARTQQARHASGSVKSDPAPPAGGRKPSLEGALAAVFGKAE